MGSIQSHIGKRKESANPSNCTLSYIIQFKISHTEKCCSFRMQSNLRAQLLMARGFH